MAELWVRKPNIMGPFCLYSNTDNFYYMLAISYPNTDKKFHPFYPTLGCDIQGFRAMGLSVQYWPRWFQDFPAIWLVVPFGANGAHLGICTLPEKIFFVCEISCFLVK